MKTIFSILILAVAIVANGQTTNAPGIRPPTGFTPTTNAPSTNRPGPVPVVPPQNVTIDPTNKTVTQAGFWSANAPSILAETKPSITNIASYFGGLVPLVGKWNVVFDGDSLTDGSVGGANGMTYAYFLTNHYLTNMGVVRITNAAVAGIKVQTMWDNFTNNVYPYRPQGGTNSLLFIWGGVNDVGQGRTPAQMMSDWSNYTASAKSLGFKVVAFTMFDNALFNAAGRTKRFQFNTFIRTNVNNWDYLIDTERIFTQISSFDYAYTTDGAHLYTNYHKLLAKYIYGVLSLPPTMLDPRPDPDLYGSRIKLDHYPSVNNRGLPVSIAIDGQVPMIQMMELDTGNKAAFGIRNGAFQVLWSGGNATQNFNPGNETAFNLTTNSAGFPKTITATNGYFLPTNAVASWPTAAPSPGQAFIGNSNGVIYLLTSPPGSTTWSATNKLAP